MTVDRVLVTGINGFVGPHLAAELASHGIDVVGFGREDGVRSEVPFVEYHQVDLLEPWPSVANIDAVVHLAGLSAVGPSFDRPQEYIDVNGWMIHRLADWSGTYARAARALIVSTGAVYDSSVAGALVEDSPLAMTSPYVVSKVLVENLTQYYRRRGFDWLVARPFNHIGPGQSRGFLVPDLAVQLLAQRGAEAPALSVGDLSTARDYTDVRDVVRAYRLLLSAVVDSEGVFNVCSGTAQTGQGLLNVLANAMGASQYRTDVDPARVRPDDPPVIVGSSGRLCALTGWSPKITIDECIADFVGGLADGSQL